MIARIVLHIRARAPAAFGAAAVAVLGPLNPAWGAPPAGAAAQVAPAAQASPAACLSSGDGYLRARLAGSIEADIDWPNSGTHCEGEARRNPRGVRLSFARPGGASPDLLFVFGITGVREAEAAHALGVNLTIFVQGASVVFGTLGDSRCTIDSLTQQRLDAPDTYRLEARGFCTQPARAVHGTGALLVSRFDFAGVVRYPRDDDAQ